MNNTELAIGIGIVVFIILIIYLWDEPMFINKDKDGNRLNKDGTPYRSNSQGGWIICIVLVGLLIATNPDQNKHISEARTAIKNALRQNSTTLNGGSGENDLLKGLGSIFVDGIVDGIVDELSPNFITRENFILFSTTKITLPNKEHTIGIGVLGKVFIFDGLEEEIKKMYNK